MRAEKQFFLDEIIDKIRHSKGFIVTRYQYFTAEQARRFRDRIAQEGGDFEVVRKRIFIKAAKALAVSFELQTLQGHVGVVFADEDINRLAKCTVKYGEENSQSVIVLGGHIEGEICSAQEIEAIAKLPALEELRAQFVGLLEAPMVQTIGVMHALLCSLLYCLEAKCKKE